VGKSRLILFCFLFIFLTAAAVFSDEGVRIKDIARIQEIRENQLAGFGLVTGLSGRGDSDSSVLLKKVIANMLSSFNITISQDDIKSKNSAVVMVTADIPPFVRPGDRISVIVSSLNDAKSLEGGVLLQTPMKGANDSVYAVAQGQISISDSGPSVKTVGAIPGGALIEKEVLSRFREKAYISIILENPDFATAKAVKEGILKEIENADAEAVDASLIRAYVPEEYDGDYISFIADVESIYVNPDTTARVVINPRSGIVVMGGDVKIGKVAVSYKGDQISVGNTFDDSETKENFLVEDDTTVDELVSLMQEIGLKANVIIEIVKAIDKAGALFGKLIVM